MARAPVQVRFDAANPRAEQVIADQGARLVSRVSDDTRQAIRDTILRGYEKGLGPRDIALDIAGRIDGRTGRREGGIIGLTRTQAAAADNLRDRLSSGVPSEMRKVLGMQMRDARFDSAIRSAIDNGEPVPAEKIQQMLDRYVDNSLRLRAETIARTETGQAVMAAQREAFAQGLEKAGVSEDAVERQWDAVGDNRTRDTHAEMDGQVVAGLDEPFVSPSGAQLLYPMDTSLGAGPEEVIQCRCEVQYNIDYSRGLEEPAPGEQPDETPPPEEDAGPDVTEAKADLSNAFIDVLVSTGGTVDEMAQLLKAQFPDREIGDIKNSIRSFLVRLPKQGRVEVVKEARGVYRGRLPGGEPPLPPKPPAPLPPKPPTLEPPPPVQQSPTPDVPRWLSSDRNSWRTVEEAQDGFFKNHAIAVRAFTGDNLAPYSRGGGQLQRVFGEHATALEKIREADRALADLKNRFEGMRDTFKTGLTGGLDIKVDAGALKSARTQRPEEARALGLHFTYDLRIQLAGGRLKTGEAAAAPTSIPGLGSSSPRALTGQGKWSVGEDTLATTLRHEYGHAMERHLYQFTARGKAGGVEGSELSTSINAAITETRKFLDGLVRDPRTVIPSRYAKTNGAELWAETFSAYTHPDFKPKSGMIDRRLEDLLDKIMKPVKKKESK